jgi:SAM-dependent methyltransferase
LLYRIAYPAFYLVHRLALTPLNRFRNAHKVDRKLEIGPGRERLPGFETLNLRAGLHVDYVCNAVRRLPFPDETFDLIYASHVLEHIPWYQVQQALTDWVRTLKRGGRMEIWTPNGLLIAKAFVEAETGVRNEIERDGWYRFNPEKDPCVWANGRIFSYGDGDGEKASPNWHMTLFSPRYLRLIMERAGLVEVEPLDRSAVRGHDHGWINLGFAGRRP